MEHLHPESNNFFGKSFYGGIKKIYDPKSTTYDNYPCPKTPISFVIIVFFMFPIGNKNIKFSGFLLKYSRSGIKLLNMRKNIFYDFICILGIFVFKFHDTTFFLSK